MQFTNNLLVKIGFFAVLDFLIPSPVFLHLVLATIVAALTDMTPAQNDREGLATDALKTADDKRSAVFRTGKINSTIEVSVDERPEIMEHSFSSTLPSSAEGEDSTFTPAQAESHDETAQNNSACQKKLIEEPEIPAQWQGQKHSNEPEPLLSNNEKSRETCEHGIKEREEAAAAIPSVGGTTTDEYTATNVGGLPANKADAMKVDGSATSHGDWLSNRHAKPPGMNGVVVSTNVETNGSGNTNGNAIRLQLKPDVEPRLPRGPMYQSVADPGPTRFDSNCHPRVEEVVAQTNAYFLDNWPFRSELAKEHFVLADANRWACLCFSLADDDRIADAANVNTLLFLLDDLAEDMNVEEGKAFYKKLIGIARGKIAHDPNDAVERVTYETWDKVMSKDEKLGNDVLDGAILCLEAQVDERRLSCTNMKKLLEFRGEEGGVLFVANLMCWSMGLHLSEADFKSITEFFTSYSNLGMVVNDILSFDKELRAWNSEHKEGARLLNMVDMLSDQTGLSYPAAKRIAWVMVREWELNHQRLVEEREAAEGGCSEELKIYMKGLEYLLAGNEVWSWTTGRYHFNG